MIQAYVHKEKKTIKGEKPKKKDIIVFRKVETTKYDSNGNKITKYERKKENITKKVNEGVKLIKAQNAQAKINEFENVFRN